VPLASWLIFSQAFGNGDGGGGPLEAMIERVDRMKSVDGLATVEHGTPTKFFHSLEKRSHSLGLPKWKGELYLELHRGTYTTQAKTKWYNRYCETLLRRLESIATLATLGSTDTKYPHALIESTWKQVLLNQFHDVLPGSSIGQVRELIWLPLLY